MSEIEKNPAIIHIAWTNAVEYYMHVANIFLFPSHREGFPNVLLQAGAMGLPIICSRIAGNVDLVSHLQTGYLFDTGNETEMLSGLQYGLANSVYMQEMAVRLRALIEQHYRRENIWGNLLEAYKSLVN